MDKDSFRFAGADIRWLEDVEFGAMNELSGMGPSYYYGKTDGSVGLGLPFEGQQGSSIIDSLFKQGLIERRIFSFGLGATLDSGEGELVLGGVDESAYTGPLQTVKIIDDGKWKVLGYNTKLNGESLLEKEPVPVLVDSGVPTIAGPKAAVRRIFKQLGAHSFLGKTVIKCSTRFELTFQLSENEAPLKLTEQDLTHRLMLGYCLLLVSPLSLSKPNENLWVLGDVLMRKYYTVFDMDKRSISFGLSHRNRAVDTSYPSMISVTDYKDDIPEAIIE